MSTQVVLLGTGGHAKVIIDVLEQMNTLSVRGFTTAECGLTAFMGYPVLGGDEVVPGLLNSGIHHAFAAIGDNKLRQQKCGWLKTLGFTLVNVISPDATVSKRASVGEGVVIMPGATINAGVSIGDGAIVNTGAIVDHDCCVGPFVHLAPGTVLAGGVSVGRGAFMGSSSGAIPRVSIGEWSTIGAGGMVLCDIPPGVTAVGIPAKILEGRLAR